jgi:DtxR family Mn-dependent transcriptional regulator
LARTEPFEKFSSSLQDYLEAILVLNRQGRVARVKDIAALLEVTSASVVGALKTLAHEELAVHESYGYVELTPEGGRVAERVLKRHEVLVEFLRDLLGVDHDIAERDACRIEHHLSEQTLTKLEKFLEERGKPDSSS